MDPFLFLLLWFLNWPVQLLYILFFIIFPYISPWLFFSGEADHVMCLWLWSLRLKLFLEGGSWGEALSTREANWDVIVWRSVVGCLLLLSSEVGVLLHLHLRVRILIVSIKVALYALHFIAVSIINGSEILRPSAVAGAHAWHARVATAGVSSERCFVVSLDLFLELAKFFLYLMWHMEIKIKIKSILKSII